MELNIEKAKAKLLNGSIPIPESGCWIWLGYEIEGGYGKTRLDGGTYSIHRLSYMAFKGPIPNGLTIDHLCRVTCCINPEHLEAVTDKVNILRGFGPTAINARKDHCKRGHPLTGDHIYPHSNGGRRCKQCEHEYYIAHNSDYYMKNREKILNLRRLKKQRNLGGWPPPQTKGLGHSAL